MEKMAKMAKIPGFDVLKNEFQNWFGSDSCNDYNSFGCVWRYFDDLRTVYGFDGHFGPLRDASIWSKLYCVWPPKEKGSKWLKFVILMFQKMNFRTDLGIIPAMITMILDVFEDILMIGEPYVALMVTLGLCEIHQYEANFIVYSLPWGIT